MEYKLPPLPEPDLHEGVCVDTKGKYIGTFDGYTAEQMQAYAIAAIEAQGVPDGMALVDRGALHMVINALRRDAEDGRKVRGEMADMLASAPPAPQAERKPLFADLIAKHDGLTEELKAIDAQVDKEHGQAEKAQSLPSAVKTVIAAMKEDPDYAWSWHCNVAMSFVDAGGDAYTANQGAARFMRSLAGVEPAYELPALPAKKTAADPLDAATITTNHRGEMMFLKKPDQPWAGPRFEYKTVQWGRNELGAVDRVLNQHGEQGWQAVTVNDGWAYMMRVKQEPTTAEPGSPEGS